MIYLSVTHIPVGSHIPVERTMMSLPLYMCCLLKAIALGRTSPRCTQALVVTEEGRENAGRIGGFSYISRQPFHHTGTSTSKKSKSIQPGMIHTPSTFYLFTRNVHFSTRNIQYTCFVHFLQALVGCFYIDWGGPPPRPAPADASLGTGHRTQTGDWVLGTGE
jgi:hypothetical protein